MKTETYWKIATIVFLVLFLYEGYKVIEWKQGFDDLLSLNNECMELNTNWSEMYDTEVNSYCAWVDYSAFLENSDCWKQTQTTIEAQNWCKEYG